MNSLQRYGAYIGMILGLLIGLWLLSGCSSISMEKGSKGSDSYEKITFRGPPKDFRALDFKFGDGTRLRAGEAATAEQPWADVVGVSLRSLLLNVNSYCKAYPVMCTGSRDAPEYTPEIIRRAEVYCRAYPAQCKNN